MQGREKVKQKVKQKVKNCVREAWRNKTPLLLLSVGLKQWGADHVFATFSFFAAMIGAALLLGHFVAKELFGKYRWDVGEKLTAAWGSKDPSEAVLAIGMLFARVAVYVSVSALMVGSLFLLRGGFGQ